MLLLVLLMFLRNAGVGFLMVGVTWLAAMTFNPNIDSGLVWTIGFALGYLLEDH